jgi:protein-S-isoprenylcysteine O-methyltransferase Ste14
MPETEANDTRPWACDMLAAAAFIVLLVTDYFVSRGTSRILHILGTIAFLLSPVLMFAPFYLLKRHGGPEEKARFFETTRVVDRGVYAVVRHPQYLGYIFLVLGFTLHSQHYLTAIIGGTAIVLFYIQSVREERFCARHLGAEYVAYMERVPRFNILAGSLRYLMRRQRNKEEA